MLICAFGVLQMTTSCLNDDDDNDNGYTVLSHLQKTAAMSQAVGSYTGKIYFPKPNGRADSVMTNFTVAPATDTTGVIRMKLPLASLKYYVSNDSTILKEMTGDLTGSVAVYGEQFTSWVTNGQYAFYYAPADFTASDGTNTVKVEFERETILSYMNQSYNPIFYSARNSTLLTTYGSGYILVKKVTVNDNSYSVNVPLILSGKK